MTTNEQPTTIITSAGEKLTAQPAEPAKATANGSSRKPAGKVRTGNPAEDRAVRAASIKAPANGKATAPRQSRAGRAAAQAKSDAKPAANARGAKATAAKAGTQAKAQPAKAGSATTGRKAGTGAASIAANDKRKPGRPAAKLTAAQKKAADARKAEAAATTEFNELRRDLFRKVIVAAGELVQEYPPKHREALARAISNQTHHLTNKAAGWPTKKLPVPDRSDWR